MGEVLDFNSYQKEPDIDSMDKKALLTYLRTLQHRIAELDEAEPEDMESEEYEEWGERHEELEDLVDEVMDRLDELE